MNNRFYIKLIYRFFAITIFTLGSRIYAQPAIVSIRVDDTQKGKPLKHVWQYYGYDECNCTTTPDCKALMKTVAQINPEPVYLRQHFLLNSGEGTAALKWSSTNVYTEDENGNPVYD